MLSYPLRPSVYRLPIHSLPGSIQPSITYTAVVKKNPPNATLVVFCSFSRQQYSCRVMHEGVHPELAPHDLESCQGGVSFVENKESDGPCPVQDNPEKIKINTRTDHGNKGRVPWNQGRKHSEETRARISQRTKEALQDPKVKKKMSEAPRAFSNQTREKIRTSITKLWEQRLRTKRTRQKFLQTWAESIAHAAKEGGLDQQELEWDSYKKIKQAMALAKIRLAAEKAEAKRAARAEAQRAMQLKAEKMALLAQRRRERAENAKETRRRKKLLKEEKQKLAKFQDVKLKERLMKIRRKKSPVKRVSNREHRQWDKFDINFVQGDKIPLADQIRCAKNNRETNTFHSNHILHFSVPKKNAL